jgi:uncharacterized protein YuzE
MPKSKKSKIKGAEVDVTSVTGKNRTIDVVYLRLLNDKVHRTYEVVEGEVLLDTNRNGDFVGVEILLPEKKAVAKRRPKAKKTPARAKRRPKAKKTPARAKRRPKAKKAPARAKSKRSK